ncbi:cilia- and flagella-associated protein 144-like isoform X2 [Rhopalosiphum padi]|uniref:cilia- and flagella-associated protein 144-like isoform X2 n=1 Tax=Rhopalosiphum padi TaxID=40932 RepID=UPI00298D7BFE|nr:cilia- and flagella-associated protein 144-like isoform X2 [Rhopalosiphum padi]
MQLSAMSHETHIMYDYTLLVELYKKEKKFQKVYTTFRPNLKGKFYARHEANVNQGEPNDHYIKLLAQAKSLGPKNKFPSPKTESQRYGWYNKTFIPRKEDILMFPHVEAPEIKLDIILKQNYKNEVPFSGIPFKL